jgi:hypothetical protein
MSLPKSATARFVEAGTVADFAPTLSLLAPEIGFLGWYALPRLCYSLCYGASHGRGSGL